MLSTRQAIRIIQEHLPGSEIKRIILYKNRYIAIVDTKAPGESMFDPFYYVDVNTGAFSDFSILVDPDRDELFAILQEKA